MHNNQEEICTYINVTSYLVTRCTKEESLFFNVDISKLTTKFVSLLAAPKVYALFTVFRAFEI